MHVYNRRPYQGSAQRYDQPLQHWHGFLCGTRCFQQVLKPSTCDEVVWVYRFYQALCKGYEEGIIGQLVEAGCPFEHVFDRAMQQPGL